VILLGKEGGSTGTMVQNNVDFQKSDKKDKQKCLVVFYPLGSAVYIEKGKTVKEASQEIGMSIQSICGGLGVCGKCKVRILEGFFKEYGVNSKKKNLSPMEETEKRFFTKHPKLSEYRLACRARIYGDIVVFIPEESRVSRQLTYKSIRELSINLKPAVKKYYLEIIPPTLNNPLSEWERLQVEFNKRFGLNNLTIDYEVLKRLQGIMRQADWKVTVSVWMDKEVIKVEPKYIKTAYGLAVDIGTTTLACYLCDLNNGKIVATDSMVNPQVIYGADVISRITHTVINKNGLQTLSKAIIKGINQLISKVCIKGCIKRQDIIDMTIVGNTCMHHILLNIDPQYLGKAPFQPSIQHSIELKARDLGIEISQGGYVHVLPIVAGFVGADTVGVLLAEEPYNQDDIVLIIDVGTNGELVLGNKNKLIVSSCATGPAFEGANIRHGMCAAPGTIEKIEIDPNSKNVHFKVISSQMWDDDLMNVKVKGICGSGIIDAVAQLFLAGIIDRKGRFNVNLPVPRLRVTKDSSEFIVAWADETAIGQDIVVCQGDIRNIQLAKAAIYAGAKIMMRRLGVEKLDKVILAGVFGSYINKKSAATIGLFPDCVLENVYMVGNAAGEGACISLLNVDKRIETDKVAKQVDYVELTMESDFEREFVQAMHFPHMKDTFPHLKHIFSEKGK